LVDAKRIDLGMLVQEAFLRRHRHRQIGARDDDRLPELAVPCAERDLLAFECRQSELIAAEMALTGAKSPEPTREALSPTARTATQA